jgi:hypothetical protein
MQLPTGEGAPLLSSEPAALNGGATRAAVLHPWLVTGLTFDATQASQILLSLDGETLPAGVALGDDVRFWSIAARFAFELLYRQRLAPTVRKEGSSYLARWESVLGGDDAERRDRLAQAMPPVCRAPSADLAPRALLDDYLSVVVDAVARQGCAPLAIRRKKSDRWPPNFVWMEALKADPVLQGDAAELGTFYKDFHDWVRAAPSADAGTFRVCFRLDPPAATEEAMPAADAWRLRYLLQAVDDPSLLVPADEVWRQRGSTARFLQRRIEGPHERLLAGLGGASRVFPPIEESLHTARPDACALSTTEAYDFLREKAVLLKANGYGVLVPDLQQKLGVRVRLGTNTKGQSSTGPAHFTWDSLVAYDWQLSLGDQTLSRAEFEMLARLKEPLVQIRGQWVELRPEQIQQALAALEGYG